MASARYTIRKGGQRKVQSYFDQSCGSIQPQLYSFGTRFYPPPCFGHIPARCTLFWPLPYIYYIYFEVYILVPHIYIYILFERVSNCYIPKKKYVRVSCVVCTANNLGFKGVVKTLLLSHATTGGVQKGTGSVNALS